MYHKSWDGCDTWMYRNWFALVFFMCAENPDSGCTWNCSFYDKNGVIEKYFVCVSYKFNYNYVSL